MPRNPSKIIEKDDYIIVIANNTGNEHIFPKNIKPCLEGIGWNEKPSGHLKAGINGKTLCGYNFVIGDALPGYMVDHIDQNPRNNLENNLRIVKRSVNGQNAKMNSKNTSGFRGVRWCKNNQNWRAQIKYNQKYIHIGCFSNKIEAAKAYDRMAIKLFGEHASTNEKLGCYNKIKKEE